MEKPGEGWQDMVQQLLLKFRAALVITVTIALAASALAEATVVTGTGNPAVDVPAVQAAVNLGGDVVLSGHFSFDTPPTIPIPQQAVGFPPAIRGNHRRQPKIQATAPRPVAPTLYCGLPVLRCFQIERSLFTVD
jgi:hypothetical protein